MTPKQKLGEGRYHDWRNDEDTKTKDWSFNERN